jgi:hypothetical protein
MKAGYGNCRRPPTKAPKAATSLCKPCHDSASASSRSAAIVPRTGRKGFQALRCLARIAARASVGCSRRGKSS